MFSAYGNVKSTKIIVDRAGVSKGYGFVTFDTPAVIDSLMVSCTVKSLPMDRLNLHFFRDVA